MLVPIEDVGSLKGGRCGSGDQVNQPTEANANAGTNDKMPSTGPEEFLPLALIAGALVAYLSSRAMAKREA